MTITALSPSQQRAVTYEGGRLLIVAGPGTGKTHTLTHRIMNVAGTLPGGRRILAVTFTNKAANEMRERLSVRSPNIGDCVTVDTFHQFCLRTLRTYFREARLPPDFGVAGDDDTERIGKVLWPGKKAAERNMLLNKISNWKSAGFDTELPEEVQIYNIQLRQQALVDFDDLLLVTLSLLRQDKDVRETVQKTFHAIFVDEYQDINAVQHRLLKILVGEDGRITAIGDPNQAIYGFRGSDVRYFERFCEDFPGAAVLSLSENYRCARDIVSASGQVIAGQRDMRVPEITAQMYMQGRLTVFEAASDRAEAEYVVHAIEKMLGGTSLFSRDSGRVGSGEVAELSFGDIAVLYRLNSQRLTLLEAFERSGIPHHVFGTKTTDPVDEVCPRPVREATLNVEKVSLMTIHAAKGLEFSCVFIVGCEEHILPLDLEGMASDPDEERRLLYVGMTRARHRLFLVYARRRRLYGKIFRHGPSIFLADIEEHLSEYAAAVPKRKRREKTEEQLNLF